MDKDIEIIAENRCFPIANAEMKASRKSTKKKMCPDCAERGIESRIRLCQLNLEEAVYSCPNLECPFPLFSDLSTLIIQRNFRNYIATYSKRRHRKAAKRPPQTTVASDFDVDKLLDSCCQPAATSGEIFDADVAALAAFLDTNVESQLDSLDNSSCLPADDRISVIPQNATPVVVMPQTDVTSHLAYPSQFPVKDRVSAEPPTVTFGAVAAQIKVNPDLASFARLSAENLKPPAVQEAKNTTTKRKRQSPACGKRRNPPVKTVKAAVTSLPQPQETKVEVKYTVPDLFSMFETQTAKKPRRPPVKRAPRVAAVKRPTETALSIPDHWLQNTTYLARYPPKRRKCSGGMSRQR